MRQTVWSHYKFPYWHTWWSITNTNTSDIVLLPNCWITWLYKAVIGDGGGYAAMKTNKMANLLQNKELTTHAPTGWRLPAHANMQNSGLVDCACARYQNILYHAFPRYDQQRYLQEYTNCWICPRAAGSIHRIVMSIVIASNDNWDVRESNYDP